MITVSDVSFSYPIPRGEAICALDHVSLELKPGEFLAVIGPNGSGKSTLAKTLNGLLVPTQGRVVVDDRDSRDPEQTWAIRRLVGLVLSNPDNQLISNLVEEEVAFGPENLRLPPEEIHQRVLRALRAVRLQDHLKRDPNFLSGGQKQRLAIASVLAIQPRYLVLDEPTSMLDPTGQREILGLVSRLHREEGVGVAYITHRVEEAALADRVILLSGGTVVREGPPGEFFADADFVEKMGIALPPITELAQRLAEVGVPVRLPQLSAEEMAECLLS